MRCSQNRTTSGWGRRRYLSVESMALILTEPTEPTQPEPAQVEQEVPGLTAA